MSPAACFYPAYVLGNAHINFQTSLSPQSKILTTIKTPQHGGILMPQYDDLFKKHATPLLKLLFDNFPNGVHPTYENVHQPDPDQQIEDHERITLKEVVNFFLEEKFVRASKEANGNVVLTFAGLTWLKDGANLPDFTDPYEGWL